MLSNGFIVIMVIYHMVWNMLPATLHLVDNYAHYRSPFEAYLFD